jgi:hypothetical protein
MLIAPGLLWVMHRADRHAEDALEQALSAACGLHVTFASLEATADPGITLRDLRVGDVLHVPRLELRIGLDGLRPHISHLAVVRPSLRLDLDQLPQLLRPLRRRNRAAGETASRPGRGQPSRITAALRQASWSVHQGKLELRLRARGRALRLAAQDVFALPAARGQQRVVFGDTRLDVDGQRWATLASVGVQLRGFQIRRGATLGGELRLPGGAKLQLLSTRLSPARRGLRFRLEARPPARRGGRVVLHGTLRGALSAPALDRLELELRDVSLAALGPLLEPRGLHCARLRGSGLLALQRHASGYRIDSNITLQGLTINDKRLAPRRLHPGNVRLTSSAQLDLGRKQLNLTRLELAMGQLVARLSGSVAHERGRPRVALELRVPPTPCQAVLASMPDGMAPRLEGMALAGQLGLFARLELTPDRPVEDGKLDFRFEPLGCRVLVDPPEADVRKLRRGGAIARVIGRDGARQPLALDRGNPFYAPINRISRYVRAAFVAAEDQRFHRHRGFDGKQLRRAFLRNLAEARFGRGASTISQQLIKNLFLDHRRNISRKLQEAVLTWRMEQVLSKRRILELYLNVVEMGPGVHGVEQAARRYFGVPARKLDPLQAAHLAALTPSPRPLAQRFRHAQPGPAWQKRLRRVLKLMRISGGLSRAAEARWAKRQLELKLEAPAKRELAAR